eukprot:NODE_20480_length_796_cov_3.485800.p3 GENE.NODE_20480_length_796_cov_3.485800~~NODE_20480_length_796_cov_3.485800.p3  ORF type:complete len:63 (-),score=2.39 NODE_20480_length_796_cov_3.485800:305-493(-)
MPAMRRLVDKNYHPATSILCGGRQPRHGRRQAHAKYAHKVPTQSVVLTGTSVHVAKRRPVSM